MSRGVAHPGLQSRVRGLHRDDPATGIKVCGLCHGHGGERRKAGRARPEQGESESVGFNHEIWLHRFEYEGRDAYPLLDEWIETKAAAYGRISTPAWRARCRRPPSSSTSSPASCPSGTRRAGRVVAAQGPGDEAALVWPDRRLRLGVRVAALPRRLGGVEGSTARGRRDA